MGIGEKIFSYIANGSELNENMVAQYQSSLIFIGDEQQIFNPLTGAYVGIGLTRFNQVAQSLSNNTKMLTYLDQHIHGNVVNSLWVEFNREQFNDKFNSPSVQPANIAGHQLAAGDENMLMTNQDIVIKGLHNYDTEYHIGKTTDDIGHLLKDTNDSTNINNTLWQHIDLDNSTYGSTGITINVHHTGSYVSGTDEHGFYYSYWKGQDYLTIDDNLTWAYIAYQNTNTLKLAKQMAVTQANRVYHDILGISDPVYIEKEFDEVFSTNIYGDLETIVDGKKGEVYVHVNSTDPNKADKGDFRRVYIYNDPNSEKYYIYAWADNGNANDYYILETNDPDVPGTMQITVQDDNGDDHILTLKKISDENLKDWLFADDGYDKIPANEGEKNWRVAWYHRDDDATAQGQMNLADGIQTIREIAYILDRITDGSDDDIINITYNIAKNHQDIEELKNTQLNIDNQAVTSIKGTSLNNFIFVNSYSTNNWETDNGPVRGQAKIDIELNLAHTYVLNNVTYAAYNTNAHQSLVGNRWINLGDETNMDYYINLHGIGNNLAQLKADLTEIYGSSSTTVTIYRNLGTAANPSMDPYGSPIMISALQETDDDRYVLKNFKKLDNIVTNSTVLDGLTTVNWVTTYFKWAQLDILDQVNSLDNDVKDWVQDYIDEMNITYTERPGEYVTYVNQVNGKIEVVTKKLPLDKIIYSSEIYGNDFFVKLTDEQAVALFNDSNNTQTIYWINYEGNYQIANDYQSGFDYYLRNRITDFVKAFSDSDIESANESTLKSKTNELLLNGANVTYFKNLSTHTIDVASNTPVSIMEYNPVDINELISQSSTTYISANILKSLYYYNGLNPTSKYFDVSYVQNNNGSTSLYVSTYVTYLGAATQNNTGLADSWDVKHTIESMFTWIDLKTNKMIESGANMIFNEPEQGN